MLHCVCWELVHVVSGAFNIYHCGRRRSDVLLYWMHLHRSMSVCMSLRSIGSWRRENHNFSIPLHTSQLDVPSAFARFWSIFVCAMSRRDNGC
jgi:hypothetical protein